MHAQRPTIASMTIIDTGARTNHRRTRAGLLALAGLFYVAAGFDVIFAQYGLALLLVSLGFVSLLAAQMFRRRTTLTQDERLDLEDKLMHMAARGELEFHVYDDPSVESQERTGILDGVCFLRQGEFLAAPWEVMVSIVRDHDAGHWPSTQN